MQLTFEPSLETIARFQPTFTIAEMADEVGVYSASPAFVRAHCGPIANMILDAVPESYFAQAQALGLLPNCDVRIHRLYPGDFPAYPGWHCDGEYRADYHAQPDMSHVPHHDHLVATVSTEPGGVSNTLFVSEAVSVTIARQPTEDDTLWGQVHEALEARDDVAVREARDGELVKFGSWTLHKAQAARTRGWRLFFRMSMWHKDYLGDGGLISKQEQVYKLVEGSGW